MATPTAPRAAAARLREPSGMAKKLPASSDASAPFVVAIFSSKSTKASANFAFVSSSTIGDAG